jgi:hypothetical protein
LSRHLCFEYADAGEENFMQNATMRDKLAAALGSAGEVTLPLIKARIKPSGKVEALHCQPRPYMADRKRSPDVDLLPLVHRYTTPPKKSKPFAVHTYSAPLGNETLQETKTAIVPEETAEETPKIHAKEEKSVHGVEVSTEAAVVLPLPAEISSVPEEKPIETEEALPQSEEVPSEFSEEAAASVPEVQSAQPAQSATAAPLPPDLSWLQKPTPFVGDLQNIVGRIRDAKTQIAFTCEQLRMRETETRKRLEQAQKDMDDVQYELAQQKDYVLQLNDMIAACALVAEQSAGIAPELFSKMVLHKKPYKMQATPRKGSSRNSSDPTICHRRDILPLFEADPNKDWNCAKLRAMLPEIKREHAKASLSIMLSDLAKKGVLRRVSMGVYRLSI